MDDFEKRLQRQPLQQIPKEWREDILSAAHAAAVSGRNSFDARPSWISILLWPSPKAWAGLASVWILIFAVNFTTRDEAPATQAKCEKPPSPEVLLVLKQQQQLRAELVGFAEPRDAERPKTLLLRPRSERDENFGLA